MKETTLRTSKNVSFDGISNVEAGYHRRQRKSIVVSLVLLAIALVLAAVMMLYGNTIYTPSEVWDALKEVEGSAVFTVKTLRLPRMLTAILAGFAFGMAGNTFQQLLGNPLASPDIIGVTSGASVAAVFGILVLKLPTGIVSLLAVISGLLVSCLIYVLSQGGGFSNARLILTGIGMQAFLNAIISWLLLKASEYDVANALRWLSGSLNGVKLSEVLPLAIVVGAAGCGILLLNRQLTMLQMGESHAITLGVKSKRIRLILILLSLLLVAFATSVTGPIASVANATNRRDRTNRIGCLFDRTDCITSVRWRKNQYAFVCTCRKCFGVGIGFNRSVCTSITLSGWCCNRNFGCTVFDLFTSSNE